MREPPRPTTLPELDAHVGQPATPGPERISAVLAGLAVICFSSWVLVTLPIQAAVILTVAGVLAWVGWVRTSYAYPVTSRKVIATYLCAVAFQFIHLSEEYLGGFPHELVQLFNFVFPILQGGYFPGLYTAGGHLVLSAMVIALLLQESRRLKRLDTGGRASVAVP